MIKVETKMIGEREYTVTTTKVDDLKFRKGPAISAEDQVKFLVNWNRHWKPKTNLTPVESWWQWRNFYDLTQLDHTSKVQVSTSRGKHNIEFILISIII